MSIYEAESIKNAIVIKSGRTSFNASVGYVTPIAIDLNADGIFTHYVPGTNQPFSDDILVKKQFDQIADIGVEEPFKVSYIENPDGPDPIRGSAAKHCRYICSGSKAIRLSKNELLHIVDLPIEFGINIRSIAMPIRPSRNILLRSSGYLYGPFEYSDGDIEFNGQCHEIMLLPGMPSRWLPQTKSHNSIYRFSCKTFKTISLQSGECLLSSLSDLANWKYHEIDFITNDRLIELAKEFFAKEKLEARSYFNSLREQLRNFNGEPHSFDGERVERLTSLLDQYELWDRQKMLCAFLETAAGQRSIDVYISAHSELVLELAKERFALELRDNNSAIESEIQRAKEELVEIKAEIIACASERDSLNKQKDEAVSLLRRSEEQASNLNQKIGSLESTETQVSAALKALKRTISQDQSELLAKLIELKPYLSLLGGYVSDSAVQDPTIVSSRVAGAEPQYPFAQCSEQNGSDDISEIVRSQSKAFKWAAVDPDNDWLAIRIIAAFALQLPLTVYGPAASIVCGSLSNTLFGGRHIQKVIGRTLNDTAGLFGRVNPISAHYMPDPDHLSDLIATQHLATEAHLVTFDGFNRCDSDTVFAPFLIPGNGDGGVPLSIIHQGALAQCDYYHHLANSRWPQNFYIAFVHSPAGDRPSHFHWTRTAAIYAGYKRLAPIKKHSQDLSFFPISKWNKLAEKCASHEKQACSALERAWNGGESALDKSEECGIDPNKLIDFCSLLIELRSNVSVDDEDTSHARDAAREAVKSLLLPSAIDYDMDNFLIDDKSVKHLGRAIRGY